jgi:hypothetical protein
MANVPVELDYPPAAPTADARLPSSTMRLLIPREHGSWGLWLLPLISGAVVGGIARSNDSGAAIAWFFAASASAFLVHQPFQAWLGRTPLKARSVEEKRTALWATVTLLAVSGLSLVEMTLHGRPMVLLLAVLAGGCFSANLLMAGTKLRSLRFAAQIVGALGLTSTAAGGYYAVTGKIDARAALLWLASWLFAAAQIAYVQLRLRTASARSRADKLRAGWKVYLLHLVPPLAAGIAAVSGVASWLVVLAFLPALARLGLWAVIRPTKLRVHQLGLSELIHNVVFATLLVAALLAR